MTEGYSTVLYPQKLLYPQKQISGYAPDLCLWCGRKSFSAVSQNKNKKNSI